MSPRERVAPESLAERLAAAGGELTWTRDGDRFEIVRFPYPASPSRIT
jgi:hypothetical protein